MPDLIALIAPHGGLSEPVNRNVATTEVTDFRAKLDGQPRVPVSDADPSTLYRLGDGGLSPLTRATASILIECMRGK
jgi:sulfate adenylyltransferase